MTARKLSLVASLVAAMAAVITGASSLATTVGVGLTAATASLLASPGCGGCHDRTASDVTTTPDASCAGLRVDDVTGICGAGPPVTLRGQNDCAEPLVFSAAVSAAGAEITVAPGEPIEVVLAGGEPADGATVEVPFQRGDIATIATFTVSSEY